MTRVSDWESRLCDYIASKHGEVFQWGINDCCTFSAGAVEALTGFDPMPEYRGQYDTALGSARALGGKTLEQVLDEKFSMVPIGFAQRGDLVLMDNCVGVVAGDYAWFVSDIGLERVRRNMWEKAWKVGRDG
jgi:hypothetical protein